MIQDCHAKQGRFPSSRNTRYVVQEADQAGGSECHLLLLLARKIKPSHMVGQLDIQAHPSAPSIV